MGRLSSLKASRMSSFACSYVLVLHRIVESECGASIYPELSCIIIIVTVSSVYPLTSSLPLPAAGVPQTPADSFAPAPISPFAPFQGPSSLT